MANFGLHDLRVVQPYEKAFQEAVSAVGGASVLRNARVFDSVADALADCSLVLGTTANQNRELLLPMDRLETGMLRIKRHTGKAAILFGSEKFGLSNEDMSSCHALLRIPTVPETPSMNLGQAVAVCLYELIRESGAEEPMRLPFRPVEGTELEQIQAMLGEVLEISGYTKQLTAESTTRKVRMFLRRLKMTTRDAPLVLGILRQVLWKLHK